MGLVLWASYSACRLLKSTLAGARVDRIVRCITLGMKQPLSMRIVRRDHAPLPPVAVSGDVHELVKLPVA
jgi:hypothetical protein